MEVIRADEIAIVSCVHDEGIYDFVHTVSHEITFNLPHEPCFFILTVKFLSFNFQFNYHTTLPISLL